MSEARGLFGIKVGGIGEFDLTDFWAAAADWRDHIREGDSATVGASIRKIEKTLEDLVTEAYEIGCDDFANETLDDEAVCCNSADDESPALDLCLDLADTNRDLVKILKSLILEPAE